MNDKYKDIGTLEDCLLEELGELIQAVCKAKRFGYAEFHPARPHSNNAIEVWEEIKDVELRCKQMKAVLRKWHGLKEGDTGEDKQG